MYIELKNVCKTYDNGDTKTTVLDNVSCSIEKGSICTILGSSGAGKSTLLNVIGGLTNINSGSIIINDCNISSFNRRQLTQFRRDNVGYIFQLYNLIPNLTVRENILVCSYLSKNHLNVDELLNVIEMSDYKDKFPNQLSGGQQQRCAIARAVVKNPALLLCDEPTGALDSKTSKSILKLLEDINTIYSTTILLVTHNEVIKQMGDQVIIVKDGKITENQMNKNKKKAIELEM